MKTKNELKELKEKYDSLKEEFATLSEKELNSVTGGVIPVIFKLDPELRIADGQIKLGDIQQNPIAESVRQRKGIEDE